MLRLILSGLVNWVCLDLEKNMKNEIHVLGWRFLGLMIFLGWFSYVSLGLGLTLFDDFCMKFCIILGLMFWV